MFHRNMFDQTNAKKIAMGLALILRGATATGAEYSEADCDALYYQAPGNGEARSCVYRQLERYEQEAQRLVAQIGDLLDKAEDGYHDGSTIKLAHEQWMKYRNENCQLDYLGPSLPHFVVEYYRCQRDMTRKRADRLLEYLKCMRKEGTCKVVVSDL